MSGGRDYTQGPHDFTPKHLPDPALPADRLQEIRGHVTARRGDRRNPHQGDCTGTRCPGCDCCMHCTSIDGACPECAGCRDTDCQCQPPTAPDAPTELERLRATVARVEALAGEWDRLSKGESLTTAAIRAALKGPGR